MRWATVSQLFAVSSLQWVPLCHLKFELLTMNIWNAIQRTGYCYKWWASSGTWFELIVSGMFLKILREAWKAEKADQVTTNINITLEVIFTFQHE